MSKRANKMRVCSCGHHYPKRLDRCPKCNRDHRDDRVWTSVPHVPVNR